MVVLKRHVKVTANKGSKALFFEDMQEGDRLRISMEMPTTLSYSAPEGKVENLTQGTERVDGISALTRGFAKIEILELD